MNSANAKTNLFVVCDGVGGQNQGEVASQIICKYFPKFLRDLFNFELSETAYTKALEYVNKKIKKHIRKHPESKGMASTLTFLQIDKYRKRIHLGWVGDSRIYHVRNGNILFKSNISAFFILSLYITSR